ncbi:hypothetical protein GW17_00007558 [Ensete ventricosum]|nr:hypothetical protein GW17_00007558 [Ensete ventricosum]
MGSFVTEIDHERCVDQLVLGACCLLELGASGLWVAADIATSALAPPLAKGGLELLSDGDVILLLVCWRSTARKKAPQERRLATLLSLSFLRSSKVVVKMPRLAVVVVVLIVFSLTFLSSSPGKEATRKLLLHSLYPYDDFIRMLCSLSTAGLASFESSTGSLLLKRKVLGSRPPSCMNKCSSCSPCMATLVAFPRERSFSALGHEEDDGYYLLAWKCQCDNKLYQP